jgi:hypothetical protein
VSGDDFLSRWSRRKVQARDETPPPEPPPTKPAPAAAPVVAEAPAVPEPLPPLESLTPESDFQPFMRADVDPKVRGLALRTLFRDPQFNVMDGLDIYIGDYSQPDPLPPEWLDQMKQLGRLGDFNKVVEKPAEEALENDSQVAPEIESKQDLPETPSSDASITPDAVIPPREVPE